MTVDLHINNVRGPYRNDSRRAARCRLIDATTKRAWSSRGFAQNAGFFPLKSKVIFTQVLPVDRAVGRLARQASFG
jgi:hypothetical protein